jgi:endonuclease YncB( thermonuclease family)
MRRFIISGILHLALFAPATVAPAIAQNAPASGDKGCGGDISGDVTGVAAMDARTFMTVDHLVVRLAGLEVPPPDSAAGRAGKAALDTLVAGKTVTLKRLGQGSGQASGATEDRYGRVVAYAHVGETSVQQALLRDGDAWVAARLGARPCADMLFSAEADARRHARGLWAEPELRPKSAANPDDIRANKGRYTLVEGVVLSVRDSSATTYLNFGRRYTRDFSVTIARRDVRLFTAAGIAPKQLEGKRIRVRGVVEMRRGPIIEATRPEQIELIP